MISVNNTFLGPNGKTKYWSKIKDTKEEGKFITFYENGRKKSEGNKYNGIYEGITYNYYDNGKILSKNNFKNGSLYGEQIYFRMNGTIMTIARCANSDDCYVKKYYETGKLMSEGTIKNGIEDDVWHYYNENEQLIKIINYKEGMLDGWLITFFPSGVTEFEIQFNNNEIKGIQNSYYENSKLKDNSVWANNVRETISCYDKNKNLIECTEENDRKVKEILANSKLRCKNKDNMFACLNVND